ncbi:hypothetical protein Val02_73250 [Virgisporangium aliadipatigenens]|uniref:Glycosyltransferase RgtA/B/C/D-like domain-containing protein n=1 Tax=Virgisporangium aliadipatigenens TaxID=741659 RepID=A0A8J4DU47_9ACTN|nr:hypothetical protein [Virgisporangium aliadipatigenens]GIJ50439.1 hypothetical protein Val02_73250 [Virgisporangium aliadipatigenens]
MPDYVPISLLSLLFVLVGLYVVTQADRYGRTWDEGVQDQYGTATYLWYRTAGNDTSFLNFDPSMHMPEHGPFFEFIVAGAQFAFDGDHWHIRALVCGIAGAIGIVAMALCGYELGGWWGAFLAASGLALFPRYTGAIFNNSKDVPLAVFMILVAWLTLRLVRRWSTGRRWAIDAGLLGVLLGMAISVRINALIWVGVLGLVALAWWARNGRAAFRGGTWWPALRKQLIAGGLIGAVTYATILACWPYIALNPVTGLPHVIANMSAYPWDSTILYNGEVVRAQSAPGGYVPRWLLVGSPLPTVLLGVAGISLLALDLIRGRVRDLRVLIGAALFFVPLAMLLVMRPVLYNGPRHFLFIVPGLILLGVYAVQRVAALLAARRAPARSALAGALVLALVGGYAHSAVASARLFPYEYMFFSPVVGGYSGARGKWEGDYWSACHTAAVEWLLRNRSRYPAASSPPTIGGVAGDGANVPPGWKPTFAAAGDYFVSSDFWPMPPDFEVIHTVRVDGQALCSIGRAPARA